MRTAAMRKFGINPKIRKEPLEWDNVVLFAEAWSAATRILPSRGGVDDGHHLRRHVPI